MSKDNTPKPGASSKPEKSETPETTSKPAENTPTPKEEATKQKSVEKPVEEKAPPGEIYIDNDLPENMEEAKQKMEYLSKEIPASIKEYIRLRKKMRRPALIFKVLTTSLSAVVTVILGISIYDDLYIKQMNNIALGLSAFMTVIAALAQHFDYNQLWVQYTKTVDDLTLLEKQMEYLRRGKSRLFLTEVIEIKNRYFEILREAAEFLHEVRSEDDSKRK